mmetsp:Transcript_22665/g.51394  ORF Transcript_22665/g.51394 Transcript_22665/m.51394 type:complete len:106 (+) Transcript_22665:1913-2230(+)
MFLFWPFCCRGSLVSQTPMDQRSKPVCTSDAVLNVFLYFEITIIISFRLYATMPSLKPKRNLKSSGDEAKAPSKPEPNEVLFHNFIGVTDPTVNFFDLTPVSLLF